MATRVLSQTPDAQRLRRLTTARRWEAWTLANPPNEILDFIQWWVWDRDWGQSYHDYAPTVGVKPSVIKGWMRDPRVAKLLEEALTESNASPHRVQAVLDMLHRRAVALDDVPAARLYLQAVNKLTEHTKVDVVVTDARALSDEDLHAELRRAVALLESQGRAALPEPVEDAEVLADSG